MLNFIMIDPLSKISYMGEVGPYQLLIILAVVLLLFGGKKIPELMKGLGTGIKGFKDGMKEDEKIVKKEGEETKPTLTSENK